MSKRPRGIFRGLAGSLVSFEELLLCSIVNLNIFCSLGDFSSKLFARSLLSSAVVTLFYHHLPQFGSIIQRFGIFLAPPKKKLGWFKSFPRLKSMLTYVDVSLSETKCEKTRRQNTASRTCVSDLYCTSGNYTALY